MGEYIVNGGKRLNGIVNISGSKNAALPVLCASVISGGKSIINNCPEISDVKDMCSLLKCIGCDVDIKGHTITVNSENADTKHLCSEAVKKTEVA